MESRGPLDHSAARLTRFTGLVLGGLGCLAVGLFVLLPLLGRTFLRAIEFVIAGVVWLATSIGVGASMWDVLGTIGRAMFGSILTPTGSLTLSILVVVGIMALYWLQRLLESEEESSS